MFAGLPWNSWLLLIAAVGIGLTIELVHYCRGRRRQVGRKQAPTDGGC